MNPIATAAKGKGVRGLFKRAATIQQHYGVTSAKMDGMLAHFARILREFDAPATFPITTVVLLRNRGVVEKYQAHNIEFAVHGYYHVDSSRLTLDEQLEQFSRAREMFHARGVECIGFRCPYLRGNDETLTALRRAGFLYDSSQGLVWELGNETESSAYRRVLGFYDTIPAGKYPSLPRWENDLIRIPYCLPDDEAFVDRFELRDPAAMAKMWQALLRRTHGLGELCTLGLHPERIALCGQALADTLRLARELSPPVWFARLDEIARWWIARMNAQLSIVTQPNDQFELVVDGPPGTTLLARNLVLLSPATRWHGAYWRISGNRVQLRAPRRPFIGISPQSSPALHSFLRQQGYIVETADDRRRYSIFLNQPQFTAQDERALLEEIEDGKFPLVRLARWYDGAQSALAVTGDIDALTVWDYSLRLLGR